MLGTTNAVSTLSNAGVIDGYEDGTFKLDGNITRAERRHRRTLLRSH